MCVNVLPECVSVYHMYACCLKGPVEDIKFPETGVTGNFKCWELNLSTLEEHAVLVPAEAGLCHDT